MIQKISVTSGTLLRISLPSVFITTPHDLEKESVTIETRMIVFRHRPGSTLILTVWFTGTCTEVPNNPDWKLWKALTIARCEAKRLPHTALPL
jgi:hypothetical protein